jgi:hypothetical protein
MARSQSNRFYIPMLCNIALLVTSDITVNASFGILPAIALGFGLVFCILALDIEALTPPQLNQKTFST